jgi:glycine/D-amino acid oxidase-like deaminating enzyme
VRRINGVGGARIVIRNRFTYDPSMEVSNAKLARIVRSHDRSFAARFPMLAGVEMEYRWGGRLCLSRNNVNLVGEVDTGLFTACCQNGLGTTRGTLSGLLAAELATSTPSARLDRAVGAAEPVELPPAPIARIGATAVLKWQEYRAGGEL